MASLFQVLANYAGLIYLGCVIGVVFYIREIVAARQDLHKSLYSLEREAAGGRVVRGTLLIVLFGAIAIATYVLATVVVPQLPVEGANGTPTPALLVWTYTPTPTLQATPTRTPKPPTPVTTGATIAPAENVTPLPPTATLGPTTLPLPAAACPDPNVQLTAPVSGQTFSVDIQLRGTADTPNFAFYKFTLKGPATGDVEKTVGDVVRTPRRDAVLGSISAASLLAQPGVYIVGLVVVDNTGNEYPHCTLPIVVQPAAP
jgi:hypothetical protein